jgi:protein-disulfide isomerase
VLAEGATGARVQADLEGSVRSGVNGTSTIFVNGQRDDGSWAFEPLDTYLAALIADR